MKGSKPHSKEADPGAEARKRFEANSKLDRQYKIWRIRQVKLKALREGMNLALARGELIERKLVELQLGFLLTATRSRMLSIVSSIGARLGKDAAGIARERVYEALKEMANLPVTLTKAQWEEWLAKDEAGELEQPPSP